MHVSIVIPCYQQEEYLTRALESIDAQDYHDIEVIVVDDGSVTPVEIIKENYTFPIKLIRQTNQGLSAARNTGIANSSGSLIKFLDADDTLLPGCLSAQVACMGNSPGIISVIGYNEIDEDSGNFQEVYPAFGDVLPALMIDNLAPVHSYLFYKSDLIDIAGFDTTSRTSGGCEDYDLVFRMALNNIGFISLHKIGVAYHRHIGSMSTNVEKMKKAIFNVWIYNVSTLLNTDDKLRSSHILPILSGLSLRLDNRPASIPHELEHLVVQLIAKLAHFEENLNLGELKQVTSLMSKHVELFILCQHVTSIAKSASSSVAIKPQEFLDYRRCLLGTGYRFDDERLNNIFSIVRKYDNRFAIYGAGNIGERIKRLLGTIGVSPRFFIDKNAEKYVGVDDVPVVTIESADFSEIDAIVIASDAYYNEIYGQLVKSYPSIYIV
ncbi:glycosyltransferase family 2 protein [Aeromonas enteropelogenes]|uniref:glycosyltransferase family 2 protein n=1 Tax=Aeromonas enteropelogenes TaxID=29489 RepID=UPI003B9DF05E